MTDAPLSAEPLTAEDMRIKEIIADELQKFYDEENPPSEAVTNAVRIALQGQQDAIDAMAERIALLEAALRDILPYAEFLRESMEVEAAPGFEGDPNGGAVGRKYVEDMAKARAALARQEAPLR